MIRAILLVNHAGKVRLMRFYDNTPQQRQQYILKSCFNIVSKRSDDSCCSFASDEALFGKGCKMVYRHFATLYFIFIVDESESELAMLDLIQVFVQALDTCFENVCELDLIFNFDKVNYILDEIVMGGLVLEIQVDSIVQAVNKAAALEAEPAWSFGRATNKAGP
eukprot:Selendium_serpulae@DN4776_c0_g1_i1.p2